MYFAAVFVILLRISFGLRLQFGFDQLFNALGVGQDSFKPRASLKEPRSIRSNEAAFSKRNETSEANAAYTSISKNVTSPGHSVYNTNPSETLDEVGDNYMNESIPAIPQSPDGTQTDVTGAEASDDSLSATTKASASAEDALIDDAKAKETKNGALTESSSTNTNVSGSSKDALNDGSQVGQSSNDSFYSNEKVSENSKSSSDDGIERRNIPTRKGFLVYPLKAVIPDLRSLKMALKDAIQKTDAVIRSGFMTGRLKTVKPESIEKDKVVPTEAADNMSLLTTASGSKAKNPLQQVPGTGSEARSKSLSVTSNANSNFDKDLQDTAQNADAANGKSFSTDPSKAVISDSTIGESCSPTSAATSFANVPAVSTFVETFNEAVKSSEILTVMFDITEPTPSQFSQLKYRYLADLFRRLGCVDAEIMAAYATRPVAKYFERLTPQLLIRIYGKAFGYPLFAEGVLTDENAEDLCLEYVQTMEEAAEANSVHSECDYPRKIQALVDGVTSFLIANGQLSSFKVWEAVFYYAHEWLLAAVDYGNLRSLTIKK